nr:MAG TPA: hypothetical protein [Caudoviricetes sp.]
MSPFFEYIYKNVSTLKKLLKALFKNKYLLTVYVN